MELEVLGDRYEMQEPIGRGGMATIYRAVDLRMGRVVAAKILREVYSTDPKFVTRFQREARAASALQHPNIVQVFDYGQSGDNYYIVMEFVDGSDLRRYLKKNGILSNERVIQIAHDVALGLGAAHKMGIVHRDVKPQNIMLNDQGLVKLTDFGIASMYKDAEAERLTTTGMTLGTVQYYAPEQAQGEIVSPAADVYALGIVMYEMITGRTPFDGDTPVTVAMRHIQDLPEPPSKYNPRITPGLERVILRCLEKDPKDRYRDGNALAYALENLGRPGRQGSTGTPPRQAAQHRGSGVDYYGGKAISSNPMGPGGSNRQSRVPSQPSGFSGGQSFGDEPTVDSAFDADDGGIGTYPYGPVGPTAPRAPASGGGRPPGFGDPKKPEQPGQPNGPLIAGLIGGAVLLLVVCVVLTIVTQGLGLFASASPTPTLAGQVTIQPTATTSAPTATAAITSTAVAYVTVPSVVGQPLGTAELNIENTSPAGTTDGLNVDPIPEPDPPGVKVGNVIKTSPAGGTQVTAGSTVEVYWAEAPTPTATSAATATSPAGTPTATPVPPTPTSDP
ncbi:MAG: protein kinase domain-containing protein [Ktedonobacterales bacterium]